MFAIFRIFVKMAKGRMLANSERTEIVKLLKENKTTLEISKIIKRDHRTVKRFVNEGKVDRKKHKTGRPRVTTSRYLRKISRSLSMNPHCTSKEIFEKAGLTDVSKRTRNRILGKMANQRSPAVCPPLSEINRKKRVSWAEKYLYANFQTVIWTDEARATLDGPEGWSRGWLMKCKTLRLRFKRQQGGAGVMFWSGIIGNELIGPFLVPDGLKMDSANYCAF